jgi:hypothetical protein
MHLHRLRAEMLVPEPAVHPPPRAMRGDHCQHICAHSSIKRISVVKIPYMQRHFVRVCLQFPANRKPWTVRVKGRSLGEQVVGRAVRVEYNQGPTQCLHVSYITFDPGVYQD